MAGALTGETRAVADKLLNFHMKKEFDVKISKLPQKTWRKYLESKSHLYQCDPKSPISKVRLVPGPEMVGKTA